MHDLVADEMPKSPARCVERVRRDPVMATRAFCTRFNPAFRGQHLQMPADRGLRELEDGPQLVYSQLIALERKQKPAPRGISKGGHLPKKGGRGQTFHPFIRI
jgi:hypothetical protein